MALPSKVHHSYSRLQDLLQQLGLTVSQKKLVPPTTKVVCLGILVNTKVSIPSENLAVIKELCLQWSTKNMYSRGSYNHFYVPYCMWPRELNMQDF